MNGPPPAPVQQAQPVPAPAGRSPGPSGAARIRKAWWATWRCATV